MARRTTSLLLALGLAGCGGAGEEALSCEDLLPPEQARFSALFRLVSEPSPKSCASCHNSRTPLFGLDFEGPGVAYDTLWRRTAMVYANVASARMPRDGEAWGPDELRLLRSWYCQGRFYEPPAAEEPAE